MLALTGIISSCKNASDDPVPSSTNAITQDKMEEMISDYEWKVSEFIDKGEDETYKFNGYVFNFKKDKILEVKFGDNTATGSWSVAKNDDNSGSADRFIISVLGNDTLDEASNDWIRIEVTEDLISLKDDNDLKNESIKFVHN